MNLLQTLVNGLLLGGIYGGFAIGLSLLLGVLRIVNLAHSAILVLGALVYWQLVAGAGMDPLLMILPVVIGGYLLGLGVYRTVGVRLRGQDDSTVMLAFFGLMVLIESIAIVTWTTDSKSVPLGYLSGVVHLGPIFVPVARLVAAALAVALLVAVHLLLTRTMTGSAVRGLAQSPDVARLVGIDVPKLSRHVFAAGVALAAFGGIILALTSTFTPQEHVRWLAWSFLVVIVGGLGSAMRTLVAGLAVGVIEAFLGTFLAFQYTYVALYVLLAVVMLLRSEGLGGARERAV
ncbi:branched-chain amino acid ABC transporter permease [Microbacterium sp. RD1]|uniref:branched-chain amino acid ABC transporter permease n=1 Tax=Microbacterium sp. RD1 TaxID=3457313 RepID=UPI003FA60D59